MSPLSLSSLRLKLYALSAPQTSHLLISVSDPHHIHPDYVWALHLYLHKVTAGTSQDYPEWYRPSGYRLRITRTGLDARNSRVLLMPSPSMVTSILSCELG